MTKIIDLKENGVVGAGGAGFPTYKKFEIPVEVFIVNAAECEPLLHKDKQILEHRTDTFFQGLSRCMKLVSAQKAIIGIKKKYTHLVQLLQNMCPDQVEICLLRDFYPAGDEITLIYETTGRVVKAGELPFSQAVTVSNVETIYNIGKKGPVLSKWLTVAGCVHEPTTIEVPLGIRIQV